MFHCSFLLNGCIAVQKKGDPKNVRTALSTDIEPALVSLANWIASSSVLNGISGATGPKASSLKQIQY
jgi:hypothetical protein